MITFLFLQIPWSSKEVFRSGQEKFKGGFPLDNSLLFMLSCIFKHILRSMGMYLKVKKAEL